MAVARRPGRTAAEDCGPGSAADGCRCRLAVERAYAGMIASGCPRSVALEAAARVYRYHHPDSGERHARDTVESWLFTGPLH